MNDDIEILTQIKSGDQRALEKLMALYGKLVFHQALNILRNQIDAEDVYQEVFIRVFRFADSCKGSSVKAWLSRIAFNCSMDVIARNKKRQQMVNALATQVNATKSAQDLPGDSFAELIAEFSVSEKEMLTMRFVSKLSYDELSEITGLAKGTLRNQVSKLIKSLRQGVAK